MCFSVQIDRSLNKMAARFGATVSRSSFEKFLSNKEINPKKFKAPDEVNRVYPNYFAPVIIRDQGNKIIKPMRYQLLPHFSNESTYTMVNAKTKRKKTIPTYNARLDSLEDRKAWEPIFMKNHCLFPFIKFFEWVEFEGQKKQIGFHAQNCEVMWAPGLYDQWVSKDKKEIIESFALITTDPHPDILKMGHDRTPIFLKEEYIDDWLDPQNETKDEIYEMLNQHESVNYDYEWV